MQKTSAMRFLVIFLLLSHSLTLFAETVAVERVPVPVVHQLSGFIEAVNQATMKAETSGRIAEVSIDVDDIVKKGMVIARFTGTRQKAELDLAVAGFEEAKAIYDRSKSDFDRYSDLYEQRLVAKSALDQASAALKAAEARLDAAGASIKKAKEEYENTIIRAPYSGIVTKRHIEVGESVSVGSPLVSGISLDAIRAVVDIPQAYVESVRSNKKAYIELADGTNQVSDKITVFPYADEVSHTFRVRVELPSGMSGLYPGMVVKIGFVVGEKQVLVIPAQAMANRGEMHAVYVKQADGRIVMRQIRPGESLVDNRLAVHAGLAEGEQIFLDPLAATVAFKQQAAK
ncbi:MAG TPA: efflux RND transporter periplasmic adaptor subunit [Gammaproteobacteria bacterium]